MCAPYTSQTGSANRAEDRRSSPKRIHLFSACSMLGFVLQQSADFFQRHFLYVQESTTIEIYWDIANYCDIWVANRCQVRTSKLPPVDAVCHLFALHHCVGTCLGESWKMQQDEFNLYFSNWILLLNPWDFFPALVGLYTFIESTRSSANSSVITQQDFDNLKEWILVGPLLSGGYSLIDFSFCRTWPARPRSSAAMLRSFVGDPRQEFMQLIESSSL